jgi:hypothetical protein
MRYICMYQNITTEIQSDQKDSKSEQALQIIGHVVAKSYANKRGQNMGVNILWSQTLLNKK